MGKQGKEIWFEDLKKLGFTIVKEKDEIYYRMHGFRWLIAYLDLTDTISIQWDQNTMLAEIIRIDNPNSAIILARSPIVSLAHLKDIIKFFKGK